MPDIGYWRQLPDGSFRFAQGKYDPSRKYMVKGHKFVYPLLNGDTLDGDRCPGFNAGVRPCACERGHPPQPHKCACCGQGHPAYTCPEFLDTAMHRAIFTTDRLPSHAHHPHEGSPRASAWQSRTQR